MVCHRSIHRFQKGLVVKRFNCVVGRVVDCVVGRLFFIYYFAQHARTTKRSSASRWNLRVAFRRRAATSGLLMFLGGGRGGEGVIMVRWIDRSTGGWIDLMWLQRPRDPPFLIRRGSTQRTRP